MDEDPQYPLRFEYQEISSNSGLRVTIMKAIGDLDSVRLLEDALVDVINRRVKFIIINCSQAIYSHDGGDMGIPMLVKILDKLNEMGGCGSLTEIPKSIEMYIELCGLQELCNVCKTDKQALEFFDQKKLASL